MAKIDDLTLLIKKYTTIYNDILVGIHADINDYKKKVENQASKTKSAVDLLNESLQEVREKNSEADKMFKKVIFLHSEALDAKDAVDEGLVKFNNESKIILTKLNHLEKNITQVKDDLSDKVNTNHKELHLEIINLKKSNRSFKIVAFLSFLVLLMSLGYLLKNTI